MLYGWVPEHHDSHNSCLSFPFYGSNINKHFSHAVSPLLSLISADTQINKLVVFIVAGAMLVVSGQTINTD